MGGTTPGPLPTKHIFLHEIAKQPDATKVRFLGCVTSYDVPTGTLVLEHAFPPADAPDKPQVRVDINLILESIQSEDLQRGIWLNVVGYVNRPAPKRSGGQKSTGALGRAEPSGIQALIVWSAGALRIEDYEKVLTQQHEMEKQLQTS